MKCSQASESLRRTIDRLKSGEILSEEERESEEDKKTMEWLHMVLDKCKQLEEKD